MQRLLSKIGWASALAAAALVCGGCQFYHYSEHKLNAPGERASEADAPRVTVEMANAAQMRGVPLQVQHAFELDYGTASVTSVQMMPAGTGVMYYRIGYIENGVPGQAVYHADGASAAPSEGVVIVPEPSDVPIAPLRAEPASRPVGDFQ